MNDKLLTLLMGRCWHDFKDDGAWNTCTKCGYQTREINPINPDYSRPADLYEFFAWLCRERPEMWFTFRYYCVCKWMTEDKQVYWDNGEARFEAWLFFQSPSRPRDLMAEWLRLDETVERWGYIEVTQTICKQCDGGKDGEMCTNGKVLAPWARWVQEGK